MKEAMYFTVDKEGVRCRLCPHNCVVADGKFGICSVRTAKNGKLFVNDFGAVSAVAIDPIEKKPLYHFFPGDKILSIGSYGCNLRCPYCQNYSISQAIQNKEKIISSNEIISIAIENNIDLLAFTYSEPLVRYEFCLETAILAKESGIKTVMVTNGMINEKPLKKIVPYIDAWNIDLKTSNSRTFKTIHKGNLNTVIKNIEYISKYSHIEITDLLVTGINDEFEDYKGVINIISKIDKNIPIHFSKYYPAYKYFEKETDDEIMENALLEASKYLNYVYAGNYPSQKYSNSNCPDCGEILIKRNGYHTKINSLQNGRCGNCGKEIYGQFRS